MTRNPRSEDISAAWTPDLFSPIFKKNDLTLREALNLRNVDEQIYLMTTFLPDEIIYGKDLTDKCLRSFPAVLLLLNISGFSTLYKEYTYDENGTSTTLTRILNNYIHIIVDEIYCNEGDLLKFSAEGLLAAWKVQDGEFMFNTVRNVIVHALNIQNSIANLGNSDGTSKVNIAISAGDVTFSVIGNDEVRHFVIFGQPISELKHAKRVSLPNDLVLSLSAWQHCTPSHYEYVIKDSHNIKVIKMLQQSESPSYAASVSPNAHINSDRSTSRERENTINPVKLASSNRTRVINTGQESHSKAVIANRKEKAPTGETSDTVR